MTNEKNDVTVPLTGQEMTAEIGQRMKAQGGSFTLSGTTFLDVPAAAAFAEALPKEQRTSPKGFANAATQFLEGFARLPSEVPELPRLVMAGLCLECLLKAYIGYVDVARLKPFLSGARGHDIEGLWAEAAEASAATTGKKLSIAPVLPWWCSNVATFHAAPYLNRYPVGVSMAYRMPNHEDLTSKLRALLTEVNAAFL